MNTLEGEVPRDWTNTGRKTEIQQYVLLAYIIVGGYCIEALPHSGESSEKYGLW